jgi:A/G-specific adenine glycosylase
VHLSYKFLFYILKILFNNHISDLTAASSFVAPLMEWYHHHQRSLPWRETRDAYKIWLSEVILQQTRVAQGLPYYQRFVEQYPTVYALAAASETEILRTWQGLGYYSRARNLHACSRVVVERFDGKFPSSYKELLQLPGIGPYTAAAIASIAFQEVVPVVDGNVFRVLARIFGITTPINSAQGRQVFDQLAQQLISPTAPDTYNQAIMEFGAIQCTPAKPLCGDCIFQLDCHAFRTSQQDRLPVKQPTVKVKQRFLHYLVIQIAGELLMKARKKGDIWEGLYDFYLVEDSQSLEFEFLQDELAVLIRKHELQVCKQPKLYKHLLTHRTIYASFFTVLATPAFMEEATYILQDNAMSPFSIQHTESLPKSRLICNFFKESLYM